MAQRPLSQSPDPFGGIADLPTTARRPSSPHVQPLTHLVAETLTVELIAQVRGLPARSIS